jgi:hypothetical protein
MALAPLLRMVVWPHKFRPHLPEKYDGTVNPVEFLQIYSNSILIVGGNEAIMANYFSVALTGTARSWLMNLPEGTLDSWSELCRQFTANLKSAYSQPGNEIDIHAIQQRPGESVRSFIQQFSQFHNTIAHISNASGVPAFRQGVRDEKMLDKFTTHDIQDVSALFSLADKCAKAMEGRAWHSPIAQAVKGQSKPNAETQAQSGGNGNNKKKKKKAGGNQPLAGAPTPTAAMAGGGVGDQEATNTPVSCPIVTIAAQSARCTTPRVIARRSAGRSRSSRNNSAKRCSSSAKTSCLPAGGRANRKWTRRRKM